MSFEPDFFERSPFAGKESAPNVSSNASSSDSAPERSEPRDRPDRRFGRARKLKRENDFRAVYKERLRAYDDRLTLCGRPTVPGAFPRLGLSVSKKVGKAFVRNRWKRLLREAFRLDRESLPQGFDFIAIPTRQNPVPTLETLRGDLRRLAAKIVKKSLKRSATSVE